MSHTHVYAAHCEDGDDNQDGDADHRQQQTEHQVGGGGDDDVGHVGGGAEDAMAVGQVQVAHVHDQEDLRVWVKEVAERWVSVT